MVRRHRWKRPLEDALVDAMTESVDPSVADMPGMPPLMPPELRSLADELVARAEETRRGVMVGEGYIQALIYIGDAILALTERLTELDR
jgi:hypothetical protein